MRADRLVREILLLQNNGKMTSTQLAAELEVNVRTIVRDMESLSSAGIPVYAERGPRGGWRLSEGYRTDLTGMNSGEILALLLTASPSHFHDLGIEDQYHSAAHKLLAASPDPLRRDAEIARERLHIDGASWHPSKETVPHLPLIQEAVWAQMKLQIEYMKDSGTVTRRLCPLGIVAKGTIWYVVASSDGLDEEEIRTYRISRIATVTALPETFMRPVGFNLAEFWEQSTRQFKRNLPRYPARLLIREDVYLRLARERYVQIINTEPAASDHITAEVEFNTLDSACEIILSYGSRIQVLAPDELRRRIISDAAGILSNYEAESSSIREM